MTGDTRFITNEEGQSLVDRFKVLIGNDTAAFDCLVGYFYSSGFFLLQDALSKTEKIRILIGLSTDRKTTSLIHAGKNHGQTELTLSHAETKDVYIHDVISEFEGIDETAEIEGGVIDAGFHEEAVGIAAVEVEGIAGAAIHISHRL